MVGSNHIIVICLVLVSTEAWQDIKKAREIVETFVKDGSLPSYPKDCQNSTDPTQLEKEIDDAFNNGKKFVTDNEKLGFTRGKNVFNLNTDMIKHWPENMRDDVVSKTGLVRFDKISQDERNQTHKVEFSDPSITEYSGRGFLLPTFMPLTGDDAKKTAKSLYKILLGELVEDFRNKDQGWEAKKKLKEDALKGIEKTIRKTEKAVLEGEVKVHETLAKAVVRVNKKVDDLSDK
ncbi:hypothetical protein Ddc_24273 [Ditylenchus destructor]|nr:hypothetical protein Ddc_24273 [Ditylenchus destructor]